MSEALQAFHPASARWFQQKIGVPTPPQELGWPEIQAGNNCLILSPTGSGKTLAAFLAGIDGLLRADLAGDKPKGVQILYISPLKALNYDIERNLRVPLMGITETAAAMGLAPAEITVGVRTGDTPSRERAKMARRPPQILITTPESLNLILTSRAASMLKNVRQVIVDEIHSLAPNKRGAFLSVLLERLEEVTNVSPTRIGLSATQRPLEEAARFLGGYDANGSPRPVSIVDAKMRKSLDVTVTAALPDFSQMRTGELWANVEEKLLEQIKSHHSTIVFANNRRAVERLTVNLNERTDSKLVEPHHGSISPAHRKETEGRLKRGVLKGVIATSTLELGIDMGAVDLVCQVQSPKTVSSGLQRVGRAGHLFSQSSQGVIITTSHTDLLEATVIGKNMLEGRVEAMHIVLNPLDVLAQQVVAMTAHGPIMTSRILNTLRRSACFARLPEEAFWRTVEMVSGRLGKDFDARVSLDRIKGQLQPLPGTLRSVVTSGGVIPDTGQFPVMISGTRLRVGELDEEFVWEAREGEAFRLGTSLWRIDSIEADRIFVSPTAGVPAKLPFWRGELVQRDAGLGQDIGIFLDKAEQLQDHEDITRWIISTTPANHMAAENLANFIIRQRDNSALPTHKRVVVESFSDALGEGRLAVITPYGARVHQALRIALLELIRDEMGTTSESMANDDGVLIHTPKEMSISGTGLMRKLTPDRFLALLDRGLTQSPLFGLRFRQNAARALLLPGARPGKRNPLWLQRLKAKDLLQIARTIPGFPIVAETARECKDEYLDTERTLDLLTGLQSGEVELAESSPAIPSPFASSMEFLFNAEFMYVWDRPIGQAAKDATPQDVAMTTLIEAGKKGIDPEAIDRLRDGAQFTSENSRARTATELSEVIRRLGGLTTEEAVARSQCQDTSLLNELITDGRVEAFDIAGEQRWTLAEDIEQWRAAACDPEAYESFWRCLADRYIANCPGVRPEDFAARYGLSPGMARRAFQEIGAQGKAVCSSGGAWIPTDMIEAARRITLAIRRQESHPVSLSAFQAFLFAWQHCLPDNTLPGPAALTEIVQQLTGFSAPAEIWEPEIFSRRLKDYNPIWLDTALSSGQIVWRGLPGLGKPGSLTFAPRVLSRVTTWREPNQPARYNYLEQAILHYLRANGASFLVDIGLGLHEDTRAIEASLYKLIWMGDVTCDSYEPVRKKHPPVNLKAALERTHGAPRHRLQQMKRYRPAVNPNPTGRWSAIPDVNAGSGLDEDSTDMAARLLLERYGVITRDIAARAGLPVSWPSLYKALEQMELSGEIERGWYIRELGGAQFALKEAAQSLRQTKRKPGQQILLNTCDPAIVTEGPWSPRASNYIVFQGGTPMLLVESAAKRLRPLGSETQALTSVASLVSLRRLDVLYWGETEVSGTAIEAELRARGFERTPKGLTLIR